MEKNYFWEKKDEKNGVNDLWEKTGIKYLRKWVTILEKNTSKKYLKKKIGNNIREIVHPLN